MSRILIIEDEDDIARLLEFNLVREGFDVQKADTGHKGLTVAQQQLPDLILLDLMLPELNGLEVCRRLKANPKTARIPLIMLTAKGEEADVVTGLELGADDYIAKPFTNKLFIARVNALIRRDARDKIGKLQTEDFEMDETLYSVTFGDELIRLTPKEYVLFEFLIVNKNFVLSRDKILNGVWGFDYYGDPRTVDTHIKSLRSKLKILASRIVTVRNRGYCYRGDSE